MLGLPGEEGVQQRNGKRERERRDERWCEERSADSAEREREGGRLAGAGPILSGLFVLLSEPQQPR